MRGEMVTQGGGLGTGDLTILFNRAASGSAPALGGRGSVCNMLVGSAGYLTYEGVRSICKPPARRGEQLVLSLLASCIAELTSAYQDEGGVHFEFFPLWAASSVQWCHCTVTATATAVGRAASNGPCKFLIPFYLGCEQCAVVLLHSHSHSHSSGQGCQQWALV
eukprot:1150594-Pelagomonas_calceolata.AAC.1